MSSLSRFVKLCSISKRLSAPQCFTHIRSINTSKKKDDTTTTAVDATCSPSPQSGTVQPKKSKFFYDYGFYGKTEEEEHFNMNFLFFTYVSMGLGCSFFYFMYAPTDNLADWAQREGYLELRRREQLGLPLIDPNYVDPSTVYLPSDEELGDTEIIV